MCLIWSERGEGHEGRWQSASRQKKIKCSVRFQHKPSVLSCFQSVARVAVSLMLHNIGLKKKKDETDTISLFIGQMRNKQNAQINVNFFSPLSW